MKRFAIILMASVAAPLTAAAQEASSITVTGSVSAATQQVDNNTSSSKFTEYRDYRDRARAGVTLSLFDTGRGTSFEFGARDVGYDDQTIVFRGGRAGSWNVFGDWSGVPHNFSTKAQTPFTRSAAGVFDVPANIPVTFKVLATSTAAHAAEVVATDSLVAAYQASYLRATDLSLQRSFGRLGFDYAGPVSFGVVYDRRRNDGLKSSFGPIGDRPPRSLNIQLTEPVDHLSQDLTLTAEHIGDAFQVQAAYQFSDFSNRIDTLLWENVWAAQVGDQTYDLWDRSVSTFGRRPLAPDNRYQNVSVSVAGELPLHGRLSATVAFGQFDQDQTLLPYSYNSNVLAVQDLPRATAEAQVGTRQLLIDYVAAPARRINFRAWARHYGMDNETPSSNWTYVTSDTSNLNGTVSFKNKRISLPYASDRTTAGAEVTLRARPARSTFSIGYELEDVQRDFRETDTNENRLTTSLRIRPADWANIRVRYLFGSRDGDYDPYVTRQSYWYARPEAGTDNDNPAYAFSNHPDMVRFDVADRTRNQSDVTLTLTPMPTISLSFSARHRNDDFDSGVAPAQPLAGTGLADQNRTSPGDQLGLLEDSRTRYAADLFFAPAERLSLNAFVNYDKGSALDRSLEYNENNKQNPSAIETAELGPWTRAGSQWRADMDDKTVTIGLGSSVTVVPNRLMLSGVYTASLAKLDIVYDGFGNHNWDGTAYPPNHQFYFGEAPTIRHDLHSIDIQAEVPLRAGLSLVGGYGYERYRIDDWQQSGAQDWVEPVGSEFLLRDTSRSFQWGNRLFNLGTYLAPRYDAHNVWAGFNYRF